MAKIKENVLAYTELALRMKATPTTEGTKFINDAKIAAIKATLGGKDSADWASYMRIFADNEQQLNRLLAKDDHANEEWFPETTAYLVGGAICTAETAAALPGRVNDNIDIDLDGTPDPTFLKPLRIP